MGFTTPCFIRKNTPELRRELEELGYEILNICTGTIISESLRSVKGVIFDVWQYCLWKGIDIEWFIEQKMRYNKLRPKLNGKRY